MVVVKRAPGSALTVMGAAAAPVIPLNCRLAYVPGLISNRVTRQQIERRLCCGVNNLARAGADVHCLGGERLSSRQPNRATARTSLLVVAPAPVSAVPSIIFRVGFGGSAAKNNPAAASKIRRVNEKRQSVSGPTFGLRSRLSLFPNSTNDRPARLPYLDRLRMTPVPVCWSQTRLAGLDRSWITRPCSWHSRRERGQLLRRTRDKNAYGKSFDTSLRPIRGLEYAHILRDWHSHATRQARQSGSSLS